MAARFRRLPLIAVLVLPLLVVPASAQDSPRLLTEPFLQAPSDDSVRVAWFTEFPGAGHVLLYGHALDGWSAAELREVADTLGRALVADASGSASQAVEEVLDARGDTARGVSAVVADTFQLSRTREDERSEVPGRTYTELTDRPVWRHEGRAEELPATERVPYAVVSVDDTGRAATSNRYTLGPKPPHGTAQRILLTSDHQLKTMTPANLQKAAETVDIDAVFLAGDLVSHPDRASDWFDDASGLAFFPGLQGAARVEIAGVTYTGAPIIQEAPLYTAIGNHEVMGRIDAGNISKQFNRPLPVEVAEAAYEQVSEEVNPGGDDDVAEAWIRDHSHNTITYREVLTLPRSEEGGERYWAETFGDLRLVSLYATRIWRPADPAEDAIGTFREASATYADEYEQGWGRHIFEPIEAGSRQFRWLEDELGSDEFRDARFRIVMLHHPIHTIGENITPAFTDPRRVVEHGEDGTVTAIRYEYPIEEDRLFRDVQPLLQEAEVDLVLNGHSHLWNRFTDDTGVHYLETSNVGNSYGAYSAQSGASRIQLGPPWDPADFVGQGDPNGLEPMLPTVAPLPGPDGRPAPYVASNDVTVFSVLDTGTGEVTSWAYDTRTPDVEPFVLDVFRLGR